MAESDQPGQNKIDGVKIGDRVFRYEALPVKSQVLHFISHSGINVPSWSESGPKIYYRRPLDTDKVPVIAYVVERQINKIKGPHESKRLSFGLIDKQGKTVLKPDLVEGFPSSRAAIVKKSHGGPIVSLLAGKDYGAAPFCRVFVVSRTTDDDWKQCLDEIRKHFISQRSKKPTLKAVLSCSIEIDDIKVHRQALSAVVETGIIVVSAAGNKNLDWNTNPKSMALPESLNDKRIIVIGGLDDSGSRWVEKNDPEMGSNYGDEVDYWVPATKLSCLVGTNEGPERVTGTSYATPVAAGVIAGMLASGQATDVQEVRRLLEEWAVDQGGLKIMKNAPGLKPAARASHL
ncbi:hypothetical protein FDECE_691 [Fusarium decemcellulare]|nr:hypothetical protein FDECE_691 [Fusarium decemcellulare]